MTLIELPKPDDPREVWVSGTEIIHLVTELIDGKSESDRATGRTSRLACKYADLAMQYPHCRIVIKDHFDGLDADRRLVCIVGKLFTVLNIDYEIGELDRVVEDPEAFTGRKHVGKAVFIKATPNLKK